MFHGQKLSIARPYEVEFFNKNDLWTKGIVLLRGEHILLAFKLRIESLPNHVEHLSTHSKVVVASVFIFDRTIHVCVCALLLKLIK